jgi:arylsulfatase A-like enzyme
MKPTLWFTLFALYAAFPAALPAAAATAPADGPHPPPNVVVFMTDDQTLRSMSAMPQTRELIGARGTTFTHAVVNNPRCCPSRATFLTGQYSHNHGVLTNGPPSGGWPALRGTDNWLPSWLQAAGYRTAHVGKFMNRYGLDDPLEVPPGWDEWYATVDPTTYRYYGYTVNENGRLHTYGRDQDPESYSTDFIVRRSEELVGRLSATGQPFFLSVAFLAPHTGSPREPGDPLGIGTPAVAPRHRGLFAWVPLPFSASFDEADISDKPAWARRPRLGAGALARITALYRQQLESLQAVDEAVNGVVSSLRAAGVLDRTLIVFTSDNGYLAGEHRIAHGKAQIYEPAIRVPLLMRGPGVPRGARRRQLVSNADLAPTIIDATGARARRVLDGRSLLPLARDPLLGRDRAVLIEVARGARVRSTAIRTTRWLYAEHASGARELYDLRADPDELESLHRDPAFDAVRVALSLRLHALTRCGGRDCRAPLAIRAPSSSDR